MIFAFVAAWLAYKRAQAANRNAILWAVIAAVTYIGTQLLVQLGFGVLLGLGIQFFGWSEDILATYSIPVTILAIIVSFGSTWLLLRYLDKIPEDESFVQPPPPPTFSGK